MPLKKKKKKGKVKKAAAPKPSTLLEKALALFGPKGENWITGAENRTRDAGYLRGKEFLDEGEAKDAIREIMPDPDSFDDPLAFSKAAKKGADIVAKEFKFVPAAETYCSIGAIYQVNTSNQDEAVEFLARAIDPDYNKASKTKHDPRTDEYDYDGDPCPCKDCVSKDAKSIITGNNDDLPDDPDEREESFKVIKGWFKKAIKLAKAAGR